MSKTDKDRPFWVQNLEHGQIDHNHTTGVCIISDDQRERWSAWGHHRGIKCKKRLEKTWYCTKDKPYSTWKAQHCWTWTWTDPDAPIGYKGPLRWVKCTGPHKKWEWDDSIPCSCDDRPPSPTCFPSWKVGRHYYHGGVPTWFVREVYHRPERARVRQLRQMAREYNYYGDLEDGDFVNRQGRNSARWEWW